MTNDGKGNISHIKDHPVVSHDKWVAARKKHLAKEKEIGRAHV